jgi:hypothetical protein
MSSKTLLMAGLLICLLLVRGANAGDLAGDAGIGTTGLGLHASILLETDINARLGVNYMKLSTIMQDTDGDTNVDTT